MNSQDANPSASNEVDNHHGVTDQDGSNDERPLKAELLRSVLPSAQPQEGSPANTFTDYELQELQAALPQINIVGARRSSPLQGQHRKSTSHLPTTNQLNIHSWEQCPPSASSTTTTQTTAAPPQDAYLSEGVRIGSRQRQPVLLDWYGAPEFPVASNKAREFRQACRFGLFTGPTNGVCPGYLQCNLVVVPQRDAFDFLLFCQRNPQACPLIEVCDVGSACPVGVAPDADLRTDLPKYAIYRDGKLEKEVSDVTVYWPKDAVAFLIGCSFSYDSALQDAKIPLRSAEAGRNVPMYRTNLKCRSAGKFAGNVVVSMKPIPALQVSKHVEITSKYRHAHGGPIAIGSGANIGIANMDEPDWGQSIHVPATDVPVFHACGVTPQAVLMESKIAFAITHSAGHMFVTDLPSHMNVV